MKKINLSQEEIETMSYDDVAYKILENNKKQMKIQELFKEVIVLMNLEENVFEEHLADFFELLSTDKRFIMLENGFWDLKINHSTKIIIDDDDDDEIIEEDNDKEEEIIDEVDEEVNYDEEIIDDDEEEDDLQDLIVMDESEENE